MWRRTCAQRLFRPRRLFQPWVKRLLSMLAWCVVLHGRRVARKLDTCLAIGLNAKALGDRGETRRVAAPSRPNPKIRGDAAELVFPLRRGKPGGFGRCGRSGASGVQDSVRQRKRAELSAVLDIAGTDCSVQEGSWNLNKKLR